jgi:hypothetical protein
VRRAVQRLVSISRSLNLKENIIMRLKTLLLIGALATPTVSVATSAFADQPTQQKPTQQNQKTEQTVNLSDIPAAARQGLEREAKGAPISKVEEMQQGGRTVYEAHVKQGKHETGIVVDASGKLVSRHSEQKENANEK